MQYAGAVMAAALIPGSFDPFHNGHLAVVEVVSRLFERVIVAVGFNPAKPSGLFSTDERIAMITDSVAHLDNVETATFSGLVTVAAAEAGADCLVKGVRGASDLDAELVQANTNGQTGGIPTILVPGTGPAALVASRYLREIGTRGGDISRLVPAPVWSSMQAKTGAIRT